LSPLKEQKQCHQRRFLALKYPQNAALIRTPLRERCDPLAGGEGKGGGGEERGGEGWGGRKERTCQTKSLATALFTTFYCCLRHEQHRIVNILT